MFCILWNLKWAVLLTFVLHLLLAPLRDKFCAFSLAVFCFLKYAAWTAQWMSSTKRIFKTSEVSCLPFGKHEPWSNLLLTVCLWKHPSLWKPSDIQTFAVKCMGLLHAQTVGIICFPCIDGEVIWSVALGMIRLGYGRTEIVSF